MKLGFLTLHWSLLAGGALFCGLEPKPILLAGYGVVLAAHAVGHLVLMGPLRATGVFLHGLGGEVQTAEPGAPARRALVAWGGVLAQLALLLAALVFVRHPDWHEALVRRNGIVLLLNLIPVRPLDGAEAFRLFPRLRAAAHRRKREELHMPPEPRVTPQVRHEVAELIEHLRGTKKVR